jgi:hypothetical protein
MVKRLAQPYRSVEPPHEDECSAHRWCEGGQPTFGKCHFINVKIDLISSSEVITHISLGSPSPS